MGSLRYLLKTFCKYGLNFDKLVKLERQQIFLTTYIRIILKWRLLNLEIDEFYLYECFWILVMVTYSSHLAVKALCPNGQSANMFRLLL